MSNRAATFLIVVGKRFFPPRPSISGPGTMEWKLQYQTPAQRIKRWFTGKSQWVFVEVKRPSTP